MVCTWDDEQFFIVTGQLTIGCFTEVAGMCLLTMYQEYSGTDLVAVLQDRHIQEGQRRGNVPAVIGVQTARMIAARCFVVSCTDRKSTAAQKSSVLMSGDAT